MENKQNDYIKKLALEIVDLENKIQLGKNIQENQQKIENIMCTLSLEDMLLIDDYITEKKLLTK